MQQYLVFIILFFTLVLFIWGRWRFDVVATFSLMATVSVGAIPFAHAFTGFSNPAVITVAMVMVITQAITQSGLVDHVVKRLAPVTGRVWLHVGTLTLLAAVLSAFMNNVGALALVMPMAMQTAIRTNRSPALLLMPISFGSILGGMTTLIGTPPNILISTYRQEVFGKPFAMFDFTPVGLLVASVGIIYLILIAWRLIPQSCLQRKAVEEVFSIEDYITEVRVTEESPLIGLRYIELDNLLEGDYLVLGLIRDKRKRLRVPPHTKLKQDDILIIEASPKILQQLLVAGKFELVASKDLSSDVLRSDEVTLLEAVVLPGSKMEGRSPQRMRLRSQFAINLIAVARQGEAVRQRLKHIRLRSGDVLLLQGKAENISETVAEIGLLPLAERDIHLDRSANAWLSFVLFGIGLIATAVRLVPVQIAFAGVVLAMVAMNIIPVRKVYESIDWAVIVLLGTMIPVGGALESTGGTQVIANAIVSVAGGLPTSVILGLLLISTMALSDVMNNAATAVVMAPIAASIATTLGYRIDPFLMTVAVGASCAFLTPIGHQNNTIVMAPGGYRFGDYWRLGLPLDILILFTAIPSILLFWPLQ